MLEESVLKLPGVGAKREQRLHELGLRTVHDVLWSFPRSYQDFRSTHPICDVVVGEEYLLEGELTNLQEKTIGQGRRIIQAQIHDASGTINLSWFMVIKGRRPTSILNQLRKHRRLWVFGKVKEGFYGLELANPEWFGQRPVSGLQPVYPLVHGITQAMRMRWIRWALPFSEDLYECLPQEYLDRFMGRTAAIKTMHFPPDKETLSRARSRLVFEEFFLFQLSLRDIKTGHVDISHEADGPLTQRFLDQLPFQLTKGQQEAVAVVGRDMESPRQMRRLLQGDVGSGKTAIAMYAAVKAVDSRGQVAIMAPTEVLARQLYQRFNECLGPLGISVGLLVGSLTETAKKAVKRSLQSGSLSVVIGTHALLTESVVFSRLTLAIIDEQHRFGVRQRLALGGKGRADLLVMTATPIPRSLALTLYGDLHNTIIPDKPVGRKPVDSRWIHPAQRPKVYEFVKKSVHEGTQAFVVFPLIEESDKVEAKAVLQELDYLMNGPLAGLRVAMLHGKMGKEKERIAQDFANGQIDVLVSTTVIEVGVDVPNASIMVIENADRFGLAQLHQLRGRVGRNEHQAHCFFIADPSSDSGKKRLDIIRSTADGLKIAEADLRLRGPGDLLGVRQSGEPLFLLADILQDEQLLKEAAQAATAHLERDPMLKRYPTLRQETLRWQQERML